MGWNDHIAKDVDCNCDNLSKEKDSEHGPYRYCLNCGRIFAMVPNGPDDFDWEETGEYIND